MSYRVPESDSPLELLKSVGTARSFMGFPLINCATSQRICLTDLVGRPRFLLMPSGLITEVPKYLLTWRQLDNGLPITAYDYNEPVDLPDEGTVGVITLSTYHDLHTWNACCGRFEKVDLSWMVILGERLTSPYASAINGASDHFPPATQEEISGFRHLYRGLIIPPEMKGNRTVMNQELLASLNRPSIIRDLVPEL